MHVLKLTRNNSKNYVNGDYIIYINKLVLDLPNRLQICQPPFKLQPTTSLEFLKFSNELHP